MYGYRILLIGSFIVSSLLPSNALSHDYCDYENSLDSDHIYVGNHSEYGSECTPVDLKTAAAVLGGLLLLVIVIPDPPLEDSNKSPAIKAFSSDNDFGFEYTKVKENFFVKFSIPKHNFSQTEHLNKVSQDHFDLSGPKIEFGLNF